MTQAFEKCLSYINLQLDEVHKKKERKKLRPSMSISRMVGARADSIGPKLAAYLSAYDTETNIPWTYFDRNLIQKVLEDHNLPKRLEKVMPEDRKNFVEDLISEIFGNDPSNWDLFQKTCQTIYRLARMGNSILVGRGSTIITQSLPNMIHLRLIGSEANRVAYVQERFQLSKKEAQLYVKKTDAARRRYILGRFDRDIDDSMMYHLTINTDLFTDDEIVILAGEAVLQKIRLSKIISY